MLSTPFVPYLYSLKFDERLAHFRSLGLSEEQANYAVYCTCARFEMQGLNSSFSTKSSSLLKKQPKFVELLNNLKKSKMVKKSIELISLCQQEHACVAAYAEQERKLNVVIAQHLGCSSLENQCLEILKSPVAPLTFAKSGTSVDGSKVVNVLNRVFKDHLTAVRMRLPELNVSIYRGFRCAALFASLLAELSSSITSLAEVTRQAAYLTITSDLCAALLPECGPWGWLYSGWSVMDVLSAKDSSSHWWKEGQLHMERARECASKSDIQGYVYHQARCDELWEVTLLFRTLKLAAEGGLQELLQY